MTPIEASSLLATLVGLLCSWKQERGSQDADRFQSFTTWLTTHKFDQLRERIFQSDELQRELGELLRLDLDILSQKMDAVASAISSVSERIDNLAQLGRVLRTPEGVISDQAAQILRHFDQSGEQRMVVLDFPPACGLLPGGKTFTVTDMRFLETDIAALAEYGFLRLVDHNGSGNPIYSMTRSGSSFALATSEASS